MRLAVPDLIEVFLEYGFEAYCLESLRTGTLLWYILLSELELFPYSVPTLARPLKSSFSVSSSLD